MPSESAANANRIVVDAAHATHRLDVFLSAALGWPRAQAKQHIDLGHVRLNGAEVKPSHKLHAGDRVELHDLEASALAPHRKTGIPDDEERHEPCLLDVAPENIPLDVLYEDNDLMVVSKPPGRVVHPTGDISRGTLANALAYRMGSPPGLVHRLDRDTSGVMVVARTAQAQAALIEQFRAHLVTKHYVALLYGQLQRPQGRIDAPIRRDRTHRLKMVVSGQDDSARSTTTAGPETRTVGGQRDALSLYAVRKSWTEVSLVDVEIKTGRTHQIRVHCAHIGHPVVADEMYGRGRAAQIRDRSIREGIAELGRQFLHAARLSFVHPITTHRLTFDAPLPTDLLTLLGRLGPNDLSSKESFATRPSRDDHDFSLRS